MRVIVIGFGYAGACTAIAAADAGAEVLLVEKSAAPGGISICSAGGLRIADDEEKAFVYLRETCGGKTPDEVLRILARGMTGLPERLRKLGEGCGARIEVRSAVGNYPFDGFDTFGFATVEDIADFDPAKERPDVRGAPQGALLFQLLQRHVAARPQIEVRLGCAAERLLVNNGVRGVRLQDGREEIGAVVLAAGGFEADAKMQEQFWPGGPALSAAYAGNTGDGIRMAQAAGADLWHMWHFHGCYGFKIPGHPFGVRVKRLPDWLPDATGSTSQPVPPVAWILLNGDGRRFMNEYEPYLQDTGARKLGDMDLGRQRMLRNPAWFVTDREGLALYPMGKPTWHHQEARYEWSVDNSAELSCGLFREASDIDAIARLIGTKSDVIASTLSGWEQICTGKPDAFGRPPASVKGLTAPFYVAPVVPVVSNTQGGPRHDEGQRVLNPYGTPIPGLWAAGECGSAFGHIYLSGGNIAECFIGGEIAGKAAAEAVRW